jgi:hypothetical protein
MVGKNNAIPGFHHQGSVCVFTAIPGARVGETNFTTPYKSASAAAVAPDDPSCIERGSARVFL